MQTFKCKIADPDNNKVIEKTLMAESGKSLKKHLEQEGHFVFDIRPADRRSGLLKAFQLQKSINSKEFFTFNQEFSVLLKAGLPVVNSLDAITETDGKSQFNKLLKAIREDVNTGESLSGAFGKYSHIFSRLYIATLQAGEKSGDITSAILRYLEYMKKTAEIRQKVISAAVYPVILTVVSTFTLLFLLFFVVPTFTQTFFEAGTKLPAMTLILITSSNMLKNNFFYFLFLTVCLCIFGIWFKNTETGRMFIDRWKLFIPFIGQTYNHYSVSKLTRTMSTILSSGTPLLEAIKISAGVLNNNFLKLKMKQIEKKLEQGDSFAGSLEEIKIFPLLAIRMIKAGENSGALEQVLNDVADFYEADVNTRLVILTSAIEPGLMVFMGLLIGFIVLAMYLPIFQLAGTVS